MHGTTRAGLSGDSAVALLDGERILWQDNPAQASYVPLYVLACLLIPLVIGIPLLIYLVLERKHTLFTVTSRRVIRKSGIIGKSTSEIEVRDVRNIQVNYGVIERLLGVGSVAVGTAAHAGMEITFSGIRAPDDAAKLIAEARGHVA